MAKRRSLGHLSTHHAMKSALVKFIDDNNITGSAAATTAAWEQRLDTVEDDTQILDLKYNILSGDIQVNAGNVSNLTTELSTLSSDVVDLTGDVVQNKADSDTTTAAIISDLTVESSTARAAESANAAAIVAEASTARAAEGANAAAISAEAVTARAAEASLQNNITLISSSLDSSISSLSSSVAAGILSIDSRLTNIDDDIFSMTSSIADLSSSISTLSSSFAEFSASIGSGGNLNVNIPSDSELYFNGDTLMTDADVYISGSGNNLYLHGTNDQGTPAKFEFSIVNGGTIIQEVPYADFGDEISDPWFKFDGDTLLTHADIYVSGSNNYLYLNGTDANGDYGIFYFDIIDGQVIIKQTGSIN